MTQDTSASEMACLVLYHGNAATRVSDTVMRNQFIRVTEAINVQYSAKVPIDPLTKKPRWELIDPRFIGEKVEPKLLKQDAIDHYNRTGEIPEGFTINKGNHLRIR